MEEKEKDLEISWYFRPWIIAAAVLSFGPLALFLIWFRPNTKKYVKIILTIIIISLTIWMSLGAAEFYKELLNYYNLHGEVIK